MTSKVMEDLRAHLAQFVPEYPVKNGYVAQLIMDRCRPTLTEVAKNIKALVVGIHIEKDQCIDEIAIRNSVERFDKLLQGKKRFLNKQWVSIVALCQEIFPVKFKNVSSSLLLQPVISMSNEFQSISGTSESSVMPPSPRKLRCSCHCESCANTQRTFVNMKKKSNSLQRKITEIRKQHREKSEKYSVKRVNQIVRRKAATIDALKKKYKESCVRKCEVDDLRNSLRLAREKAANLAVMVREHKSTVEIQQKQLQKAEEMISKLAIEKEEEILLARREHNKDCSSTLTATSLSTITDPVLTITNNDPVSVC